VSNTLTITGTTAVTNFSIAGGSTLSVGGNGNLLTIQLATTAAQLWDISGTLIVLVNGVVNSAATSTLTASGNIQIAGGTFGASTTASTITATISGTVTLASTGTFQPGSTGAVVTTITGSLINNGGTITSIAATLTFGA